MNTKSTQKKFSKKYSVFNALLIISAVILQISSIKMMITERGRFEFGGEWLVTPMLVLLYFVVQAGVYQAKKEISGFIWKFKQIKLNNQRNRKRKTRVQVAHSTFYNKTHSPKALKSIDPIRVLKPEHRLIANSSKQYMHAS